MAFNDNPRRRAPKGRVVAGAAVVVGFAASVGLLLAAEGPDLQTLAAAATAATAGTCSIWPMTSAIF